MNRFMIFSVALFAVLLFSSCALVDPDKSLCSPVMWGEIDRNRENLKKIRLEMEKSEVLAIMGQPMKDEVYGNPSIWCYYIRTRWSDGRATRDECVPLFFDENDMLIGWGEEYYKNNYNFVNWSERGVRKVLK